MALKKKKQKKVNKFIQIFDYKMILHDIGKFFAIIPTIISIRLKTYYVNRQKPKGIYRGKMIIFSNHSSFMDPIILLYAFWRRRLCFVATKDLFRNKLGSFLLKSFGCIPIDKQNVSVKTFKDVKEKINRGHIVGLFPEGEVVKEETAKAFKSGVVMMAIMADVPILPVYIHKRTKWYKRQIIMIGEKIDVHDYITSKIPTVEEMEKFTEVLYKEEEKLKQECLKRINKR